MKFFNIPVVVFLMLLGQLALGQQTHEPSHLYGARFDVSLPTDDVSIYENLALKDSIQIQMTGQITDVCQAKGCWMKVALNSKEEVFVRFKDYGFFVPKDIVGDKVVMNGKAFIEEMSVEDQKHYAEDKGASQEEIARIKEPKRTLRFEADGVLISD